MAERRLAHVQHASSLAVDIWETAQFRLVSTTSPPFYRDLKIALAGSRNDCLETTCSPDRDNDDAPVPAC